VRPPQPCERPFGIAEALGESPAEVMVAREYFCVFADEAQIRQMKPDMGKLAALRHFAVIVTAPAAPGRGVDFVSRFFAPLLGIPEDPVTGSAHTTLIPYWSKRLGKTTLVAEQVSARGGRLECRLDGARVRIAGRCVPFLKGEIEIPA
jgi:predicted PhzF superfamily epimerase YddE/YHI9